MKKFMLSALAVIVTITNTLIAQDLKEIDAPVSVKAAFAKKQPDAKKISWEKERGNYEGIGAGNCEKIILLFSHRQRDS